MRDEDGENGDRTRMSTGGPNGFTAPFQSHVTYTHLVVVRTAITWPRQADETVQVKLALKGRDLGQLEETRQQVSELVGFVYGKRSAVTLPRNDVTQTELFNRFEHL